MPRQYDDFISSFLEWTYESEAPSLYREWVGVSVVAAALRRKCYLQWGSLRWFPNMYIVLVGPSGARKGTAMDPGYTLLSKNGLRTSSQATTREGLIREINKCQDMSPTPDGGSMSHSSLTVYSKEFTVFLGYNNYQLMSDLSDWYDGGDGPAGTWNYRPKGEDLQDEIVGVWVNLIGATTPELIQSSLPRDAIGGGLTARIIFVFESKREKTVIFPETDKKVEEALSSDLGDIALLSGGFSVTEDLIGVWTKFRTEDDAEPPFTDDRFEGYFSRRATHVMKLSQIISASSRDTMVITGDDMERAIDLLIRTEVRMPETFRGVGESLTASIIQRIMRTIATNGEISFAKLYETHMHDIDRDRLIAAIRSLETIGFAKMESTKEARVIRYTKEEK